jgi:hypothetical protein
MQTNRLALTATLLILALATLACGLGSRAPAAPAATPAAPAANTASLRQWATSATASSQYGDTEWAAAQAVGAPNTLECGDLETAWAAATSSEVAWLEVTFSQAVIPSEIRIHESYNPQGVIKVEVIDASGQATVVATPQAATMTECPFILNVPISSVIAPIQKVRLTIDQSELAEWVEIDAVELVGAKP